MAEGEEEEKKNIGGDENLNPNPNQFPPGFRFMPTDDELIEYYLLPRLQDRPHVPNDAIIEDYVYSCHPDDLLLNGEYKDKGQDDIWYFLSPTARKYANGGRPSRGTHDRRGRWKASTGGTAAVTGGNIKYCFRVLNYYNGPSYKDEDKSNWLMRELTVPQYKNELGDKSDRSKTKTLDKFVMCKIYMSTREPKNKKMDDGAGPSGKCEEKCPPASQPGQVETGQETAKPETSKRQKGKRPVEAATPPKQSPPAPPPDGCLGPQAGAAPTQSLYGGGMQACSGTTGYHHHYGGTGRPMAYNPHTSMPRPPVAFNSHVPDPPTPVPSPGYFEQMMMRQLAPAGQAFRPPRPMTVPGSPAAGQAFRPPRPMTVPSSSAGQAWSRPPRPMTVPSSPAGQASRPPRPMTALSYPVMQRQPETEEMRERRVYQQHMNELMMLQRMMQQQQQQPGNAAYAAQQSRPMPFIQQQQQPHFGAGFNHQHAMPMPPQFLHCNYHQPVEAGQQAQCDYPVPDSVAAKTTPAEAEAGSIVAKNEGTDVKGGECNNDKEKGSVEVPTEEQPRLTAMTPNIIQRTGVLAPKLESDD